MSLTYLLSGLVLPPTSLVLLTLLGLLLLGSRPRFAVALMAFSQLALLALSMPVVAGAIALERSPARWRDGQWVDWDPVAPREQIAPQPGTPQA